MSYGCISQLACMDCAFCIHRFKRLLSVLDSLVSRFPKTICVFLVSHTAQYGLVQCAYSETKTKRKRKSVRSHSTCFRCVHIFVCSREAVVLRLRQSTATAHNRNKWNCELTLFFVVALRSLCTYSAYMQRQIEPKVSETNREGKGRGRASQQPKKKEDDFRRSSGFYWIYNGKEEICMRKTTMGIKVRPIEGKKGRERKNTKWRDESPASLSCNIFYVDFSSCLYVECLQTAMYLPLCVWECVHVCVFSLVPTGWLSGIFFVVVVVFCRVSEEERKKKSIKIVSAQRTLTEATRKRTDENGPFSQLRQTESIKLFLSNCVRQRCHSPISSPSRLFVRFISFKHKKKNLFFAPRHSFRFINFRWCAGASMHRMQF